MEYNYSVPLDPSIFDTQLRTTLPLRKSIHEDLANRGSESLKRDWVQLVGPVGEKVGGLNPKGHAIAICYPECLPERIELISYYYDYALFQDGTDPCGITRLATHAKCL